MKLRLRLPRTVTKALWASAGRGPYLGVGEGAKTDVGIRLKNGTGKSYHWRLNSVLIDTGADRSGIPEKALAEIEAKIGKLKKVERPVLTGAGLHKVLMIEDVTVCVGTGRQANTAPCCAKTSLLVIPDLQANFLLGRDLMIPCKTRIDFPKGTVCVNGACTKLEGL